MSKIIRCDQPRSPDFAEQLEEALRLSEIDPIQIEFSPSATNPDDDVEFILKGDAPIDRLRDLLRKMEQAGKPTIAQIDDSIADLRLEVALACNRQIASQESFEIKYTWLRFGLMPLLGSTQRLPRLVSLSIAAKVLLFGESVPFSQLVLESEHA